ncbi:helix-turn-helix domain-containing protein [Azorhizobium oxalatiphilum]|uniref:helix-turn-helix domain-containing protein n=1 Tax=Azorhizobium oxalatiphilum TaxID=980631 RepID=UPI001667721F|nr:helix-turn-helix domain-containing protein [Azorhizobium oxalatiphilum]
MTDSPGAPQGAPTDARPRADAAPAADTASHPAWHAWTRWPPEPAAGIPELVEEDFVLRVLDRIEADFSRVDDLEALADLAGLSPFHFHRRFAEVMGETVVSYGRRIRLEAAASRICRTPASILHTAHAVGYGSQAAFTRAFSRRFGLTPNRLRALAARAAPAPRLLHHDFVAGAQVTRQEDVTLLAMRFHGGFDRISSHWARFGAALEAAGIGDGNLNAIGLMHDDPALTAPSFMRFDCAVVDPDPLAPPPAAPFRRLVLRAGTFAGVAVSGTPDLIAEAAFALCAVYLPRSGRMIGRAPGSIHYQAPPWQAGEAVEAMVRVPADT